jgi:hypothetical protein
VCILSLDFLEYAGVLDLRALFLRLRLFFFSFGLYVLTTGFVGCWFCDDAWRVYACSEDISAPIDEGA